MINKEIILNADGSIKKDFSDRAIPQNSNNQVSVNVLIPSTCFTGLQNYAVLLAVSRIIGNSETTLNTLVMSVSKSITIDGVVYVKYTAYLSSAYTDKLGQLKFSPYIQTTATITEGGTTYDVISIQQSFTNSNLNVIKSVLPQYDASLEEGNIASTIIGMVEGKKIYTFIDDATSDGEHYYNLVDGFNPVADQFKGCLVVSVYNGATTYIMPHLNDGVELLEITSDGVFNKISNVSYDNNTYTYTKQKLSYTKNEIDGIESGLQNQIDALNANKVDKTQKVNGYALSGDITLDSTDVGLGNVANYGVETTPTAVGNDLYITSKGVYDALQAIYGILDGKVDDADLTSINNRLDSIEEIIGSDSGDADSVINTLKEVIVVLNGLGEGASLLDLINAKANQSDLTALDNQINGDNGIVDKVDLLSERENAYMEIKNSLGTIDIAVSDWVENTDDAKYPYKWELTNGYLENAVNCIVVYDKDSDTSMLSATAGIDEENGKLIIYASELPSDTISIEKIAVFNDLNAYINYSNEIVQQVLQNTNAISDINNTKLPTYVKKEIIRDGYRTFVKNDNYAENGSQVVDASLQAVEISDANNFTNCSVRATLTGAMLSTTKVEDGVATTHALQLDTDGNLTLDGNAVGGASIPTLTITQSQLGGGGFTPTAEQISIMQNNDIIIFDCAYIGKKLVMQKVRWDGIYSQDSSTPQTTIVFTSNFIIPSEESGITGLQIALPENSNVCYMSTTGFAVPEAQQSICFTTATPTNSLAVGELIFDLEDIDGTIGDYSVIVQLDSNGNALKIYSDLAVNEESGIVYCYEKATFGTKYQHNITLFKDNTTLNFSIINDSNTALTLTAITQFLYNNGFVDGNHAYCCSGYNKGTQYASLYINIYSANGTTLNVHGLTALGSGGSYDNITISWASGLYDTVIAL